MCNPANVIIAEKLDSYSGIRWRELLLATDALREKNYWHGQIEKAVHLQRMLAIFFLAEQNPRLREILRVKGGADSINKTTVLPIFKLCREKLASDPKDKIFALYSIFRELKIEFPLPDYNKSVEDVYREATIACIDHDRDLRVLFDVPSDDRLDKPNLASWVPDWSDAGWGFNSPDARLADYKSRFCPAGPSDSEWSFVAEQKQLHVSGRILDEIIYYAPPMEFGTNIDMINATAKESTNPSPTSPAMRTLTGQMS